MKLKGLEYSMSIFIESVELSINKALEKGDTKEEIAKIFIETFADYCGGINFYIPKNYARNIKNNARNRLIRKEFNGTNHQELAIKYRVSLQWIYKIVKEKEKND